MRRAAFVLYLGSMIFGVLFFGAIHTWVYTIVFLGVLAASLPMLRGEIVEAGPAVPGGALAEAGMNAGAAAAATAERSGEPAAKRERVHVRVSKKSSPLYFRWVKTDLDPLFFFFFVFLILQMIPLPPGLLGIISPEAKTAAEMARPAALALAPEGLAEVRHALSPYLYPVRMSFIRWIVYGLFFFGLIRCLNSRARIETAIVAILLLCCFDVLYGIIQTYSGNNRVWWFKPPRAVLARDVSGTYLNRNHFAGLMEMGIALAVAYAGALGGKYEEHHGPLHRRRSIKQQFLEFFTEGKTGIRRFLVVFAGGVMGLGLILSASRGGIIATADALLVMGLLFSLRTSQRRKGRVILIIFGIALIYGLYAGLDYTLGRFETFNQEMENRLVMAVKAVDLFKDYLATGVGVGNFRHAYGKYQDPVHKNLYVDYAHNDYVQFFADAGIIGGVLLLAGIGWYIARTFRLWRKRSDPFAVCLGIAPFGVLFAIAIHSVSDYNLHRPANVMVLIAVIAIGYAAIHLERRHHRDRPLYRERMIPLRPWGGFILAGAAGLIIGSGVLTVRHFIAEAYCNTDINITLNLNENPSVEEAQAAMAWDSGNAAYPYKLARALMETRDKRMQGPTPDTAGWQQSHGPIIAELERAIRLNPLNPEYHIRLAWEYSYLFDRPDYSARWLPAADICMERAAWFAGSWPQNLHLQYDMGNYWVMRSKTSGPLHPKGEIGWTRALGHYRKGMELEMKKELPEDVKGYLRNFVADESRWPTLP